MGTEFRTDVDWYGCDTDFKNAVISWATADSQRIVLIGS